MKRYITAALLAMVVLVVPGVAVAAPPEMCQEYLEHELVREAPCPQMEQEWAREENEGEVVATEAEATQVTPDPESTSTPVSFHSEPSTPLPRAGLSLAQARWFVEREARKWPMSKARDWYCRRLSPATVACSFWSRLGINKHYQSISPPRKTTEIVEYTGAPVRIFLAGQYQLTQKEVAALEGR